MNNDQWITATLDQIRKSPFIGYEQLLARKGPLIISLLLDDFLIDTSFEDPEVAYGIIGDNGTGIYELTLKCSQLRL